MTSIKQKRLSHTLMALSFPWMAQSAMAGYGFEMGDIKGEFGLAAGASYVNARNVNFGSGRIDVRSAENGGPHVNWQEAFLKPSLTLNYMLRPEVELLAGASAIGAKTFGDGDAGGFTRSSDGRVATEELYAGVRAGNWKLTAGRQNFMVGTGFIVMDGHLDIFKGGAYFLSPRSAFKDSAVLAWDGGALKTQAFSLKSDENFGNFRLSGGNLDFEIDGHVTLGAMALKVNAPSGGRVQRDGMEVYNLRALQGKIPNIPALTINAEYAIQRGGGGGITYDASAWYGQMDYAFDNLPLKPVLSFRRTRFSGDGNPADNKRQDWDALSKGFTGWSTWLVGDIVGNYLLFNSNERVQQYSLKMQLNETLTLGGIYYQFWLDKPNYNGIPVSDRRFADEFAIYLDWTPTPDWYVSISLNRAKPKAAARQAFGMNRDFTTLETYFNYRF